MFKPTHDIIPAKPAIRIYDDHRELVTQVLNDKGMTLSAYLNLLIQRDLKKRGLL